MTDLLYHAIKAHEPKHSQLTAYNRLEFLLPDSTESYDIDGSEIIEKIKELTEETSGPLKIPLHEPNSAELSGEHVELEEALMGDFLVYRNPSRGKGTSQGKARESVRTIYKTRIGQRLRFWSDNYEPPSTPSYAIEPSTIIDEDSPPQATPVSPHSKEKENKWFRELEDFVNTLESQSREENKEAYRRQQFYQYADKHGGIPEAVSLGRHDHPDIGEVYEFVIPAEDEDDPEPIDPVDEFDLYPEMEVLIDPLGESQQGSELASAIRAKFEYWDTDDRMIAFSTFDTGSKSTDYVLTDDSEVFQIVGLLNRVPFNREREAIKTSQQDSRRNNILLGKTTLDFTSKYSLKVQNLTVCDEDSDGETTRERFYDPGSDDPVVGGVKLNEFQAEAAERALRAKHVYCIHGPPGTGKTRTLNAITRQVVAEGGRVLVCAHSNSAVDNLLVGDSTLESIETGSLHELAQDPTWNLDVSIARAGSGCENKVVDKHYVGEKPGNANIVATTASAAADFDKDEFDIAIIDEATQANIPSSLIPYVCSEKIVLAGDHKQLPPYKSTEAEERPIRVSLFEHFLAIYDSGVRTMLRRQYRMNEEIAEFPSTTFYGGELQTDEINRMWTVPDEPPLMGINVNGEEEDAGVSKKNSREAKVVAKRVKDLREKGVPMGCIGIITTYRGQIDTIQDILDEYIEESTRFVTIDTIDSFQGSEREAIIVSFVRSNDTGESGFLTFPEEGPRRLNVALTRAKKHLTLVGDFETLGKTPHYKNADNDCSDVYLALAESLRNREMMVEPSKQVKSD
ncbi:DEAD/DEAH box helicase [Haloterrigena salifodinae]|uniref:DEAD/DEAH box helicase n=1 Tax=Haloterrigena salifodinae TaxID=2675099 RepID=UPI000F87F1B7|nr:AAA domain-containing protein [Haloterrigena salifodinae]